MNVFYSWQSDLNHEMHLKFIREALTLAIARAGKQLDIENADRPDLDEAAKDRRGAENIVARIRAKIDASAVYVADITPIVRTPSRGRLVPNPNVMFELGLASRNPGYEKTILIMNDAEGYQIKDMPFDIVQRPIITYTLKKDATPERRQKVLDALVDDLSGAITANLKDHIDEVAKEAPIPSVPAMPTDPSRWKDGPLVIQSSFGEHNQILIPARPRAYIRVQTIGWSGSVPSPDVFIKLPEDQRPEIHSHHTQSHNASRCEEGAVRYWITESTKTRYVSNDLAVFFEEQGEIWVIIGSLYDAPNGKYLDLPHTFAGFARAMSAANKFMDRHGARYPRNIDAGVMGLHGTWIPVGDTGKQGIKQSVRLSGRNTKWDEEARLQFRLDLLNQIRSAFVMPASNLDDLAKIESSYRS